MSSKKIYLPTITGVLKQWRHDEANRKVLYKDPESGKPVIINYAYLVPYPATEHNEGAYYLLRTHTKEYYMMKLSDEYKP